jgi:hypothetical protein
LGFVYNNIGFMNFLYKTNIRMRELVIHLNGNAMACMVLEVLESNQFLSVLIVGYQNEHLPLRICG